MQENIKITDIPSAPPVPSTPSVIPLHAPCPSMPDFAVPLKETPNHLLLMMASMPDASVNFSFTIYDPS
jgi:hypothetical protein